MEKRGAIVLFVFVFLAVTVIFISGCSHFPSQDDKKVVVRYTTPTPQKTTTTTETLTKTTATGLGNLCTSLEACKIFCQKNPFECLNFCQKNPSSICDVIYKEFSQYQWQGTRDTKTLSNINLPECSGQVLTISHINPSDIREIIPLGNLNPPEHTLPTEHIYFHIAGNEADIKSPGDIIITELRATIYLDSAGKEVRRDYGMTFAICKDLFGYFLHITKLVPELESLVNENCQDKSTEYGGGNFKSCNVQPNKKIVAGTQIGKVGGSSDFGMYDYRIRHGYANPSRYTSRSPYIVCPLENYDDATKVSLYGKVQRTADPRCGKTFYDLKGTVQGNWFYGKVMAEREWQNHLAFAYDNKNPAEAAISVGGIFMTPGRIKFSPQNSGTTNRAFAEVTPDGNVYCYQGEFIPGNIYSDGSYSRASSGFKGAVLVKLVSETELQIEESSSCSSSLQNPTVYKR